MKVLLVGIFGHMGQYVVDTINSGKYDAKLVGGVDPLIVGIPPVPVVTKFDEAETDIDIIVDFSHHALTYDLVNFAVANKKPVVIATTGQTEDELEAIISASKKIPVFYAANYSIGIATLCEMAKLIAVKYPDADIEIVETHHNRKIDAPSGTALALAKAIQTIRPESKIVSGRNGNAKREENDIGISSIRMGNIVGIHEILISTASETITLKHEAHTRALFAEGAMAAAKFLVNKEPGLYTMNDMVKL